MNSRKDCIHIRQQDNEVLAWSDNFTYSWLHTAYKTGAGCGLQLNESLEHRRGDVEELLALIAEKTLELGNILNT